MQGMLRLQAAKPRLGGRRGAPIQVAATTKAKITQARQAAPSTSASKPTALQNVQFRNANEARAAVEMMEPLLAKAQAMLTKKVTGACFARRRVQSGAAEQQCAWLLA